MPKPEIAVQMKSNDSGYVCTLARQISCKDDLRTSSDDAGLARGLQRRSASSCYLCAAHWREKFRSVSFRACILLQSGAERESLSTRRSQVHIKATAAKLRGLGVALKLKGSDEDKRRILQKHCDAVGVAPVISINGEPAY